MGASPLSTTVYQSVYKKIHFNKSLTRLIHRMSCMKCVPPGANQLTSPGNEIQRESLMINPKTENKTCL